MTHDPIRTYLEARVEAGETPGAAWAVASPAGIIAEGAVGARAILPGREDATVDTLYDLASLTKPLVTSLLLLRLGPELGLGPETPARGVLHEFDRIDKQEITIGHLLSHTSGLPAWRPYYLGGASLSEYLVQMREEPLQCRPGRGVVYSCAGYLALGEIIQRAAGAGLDRLFAEQVGAPLGLMETGYRPEAGRMARVAPTEDSCHYERGMAGPAGTSYRGFREGVIRAEVHDQNAWAAGGVAGNAGLFSTARETARIALEYLGGGGLLDGRSLERARRDATPGLEESRSLCFRLALRGETAAGPALPSSSFGHTGFTGTSVWIDPERRRVYVLLTNRIHPRVDESVDMLLLRRGFHAAAADA